MSDASTRHMIEMYVEDSPPPMFLSGFFRSPPRNFHTSEFVELDIVRDDEDVAVVIQDLKAGARYNESTKYTNKSFAPPVFKEVGVINSYDMIKRRPGQVDFTDPDFNANAMEEAFIIARKLERKIRRSIELMAAQVLQTGTVTLTDQNGNDLYTLDFQPKTTHMATTSTTWAADGTTGDPIGDLASLGSLIRRDGRTSPTRAIFGSSAMARFLANAQVKAILDNKGYNFGEVAPTVRGEGATFMGWFFLGNYRTELWMYDGYYKHPQTGVLTPYVDPDNVIMLSDKTRLDLSFGAIPRLFPPDPQIAAFLPDRMSNGDRGIDLSLNAWISENREHLNLQVGARPLTIPTAIDGFARLNVTV